MSSAASDNYRTKYLIKLKLNMYTLSCEQMRTDGGIVSLRISFKGHLYVVKTPRDSQLSLSLIATVVSLCILRGQR